MTVRSTEDRFTVETLRDLSQWARLLTETERDPEATRPGTRRPPVGEWR